MKNLQNVRYTIATIATVAAVGAFAPKADAQTQSFDATVEVSNALTLAKGDDLNFGILAVARAPGATANITISPGGVLSAPTNASPAYIAVVNNAAATAATIDVSGGADGANINVNIPVASITAPINGNAFALGTWQYTWNGGLADAIVPGTAEVVVFDAAQVGGLNRLAIGATLTTTAGPTAYIDGVYAGSFNVVFSY